ncbi:P-loop containing nucleoside triphosphate hydrolase protein [Paraphoma chrysanthemicola]|uniref:P-loop containing nucleoside triphosphate hydrolase protein n=1 Tax=Paraphoma chrysanthemicola TaxID=798071 RepID=A0A8K0QXF1_9PLEO|nr:P-loop containing nucleoside triphosphate hydrolase protein [Paraphoma chrysanthemicola]
MRPPMSRPNLMSRGRSATPALDGRSSRAESVASTRAPRSSPLKRKERDFDEGEETNINVVVRCRGRNDREVRENSGVVVSTNGIKSSTVELSMGANALSNKTYQFDKVFSPAADQNMVFDEVVSPILDEVLNGFNCTIFAYGQTGTGKTYTMTGDISDILPLPDAAGIIPRVLYALFQRLEADETESSVKCSFIELYNEELRDLFSTDDTVKLKIFEDNSKKGHSTTLVQGMEECHLKTAGQGIELLREGSHKRQVAATKCNDLSSRSHTVFTIMVYIKRMTEDGQEYLSAGKLNLVDLAGSENIQRSGAENKRAAEAGLINKSLLTLGRVINALVERSSHIPYRESKLTRLLQDSLGGRTKTCIIATVSPAKSNLEETISTLDYAFRAKNIRNKPQVNQAINKKTLLKEFTAEIEKLKSELIATRQRNGVYLTQENYEEITTISESRRILSEEQRDKLDTMEVNLRNKVEDLFKLTTSFQTLKKDNEQTQLALNGTKGILEKTEIVLEHTRQNLAEETELRKAHQKTEGALAEIGQDMISTLGKTTSDIDGLRSKIRRKSELQSQNRRNWASSQTNVLDTTRLVEDRIEEFQQQQEELMAALSDRMQTFVRDELDKLGTSQSFLQEKMEAYQVSEQEVNEQTAKSRDDMNEVLEEIKTLREDVKQKIGAGLDELSGAAETISASIITELEAFHTQVHSSYASLGRDFKTTFDDLVKDLNDQQAENERLHQQVLEANAALLKANKASQGQITHILDEEKQRSAEERQRLLSQITALVSATADAQEIRLSEKLSGVSDEIGAANTEFEAKQDTYTAGITSWSSRSQDILAGVSKSRDAVKTKIKSDFAVATQHSTSIKDTTTSVHASTVKTVEAQMAHLDTQLQSLDDIVAQIREQNNTHHTAHTTSLSALSSTVQVSYASIGEHLSSSFERVQSLEADVSAQAGTLKNTLPTLGADADIRAPLHELRENIGTQNLIEYNPTGETPQRVSYQIPSNLPRTEAHESLLSRLRDRPTTSETSSRSPSKQPIFNDATNTLPSPTDMFKLSTTTKPLFARSISAHSHAHTIASLPLTNGTGGSLRELDINIVAQESAHTQPLPLVSQSSDSMVMAVPPHKKQRSNGDDGSKLPMKKMRKTVAGIADRENLSITNFANSVGPGVAGTRRLRSHGSQ